MDYRALYKVQNDRKYRFSGYVSHVESFKVDKFRDNRENVVFEIGVCEL